MSDPEYVGDKDVNKDVVAETLLQGVLDRVGLTLADGEWMTEREKVENTLADTDTVEETQVERVMLALEQKETEGDDDTELEIDTVLEDEVKTEGVSENVKDCALLLGETVNKGELEG